MRQMVKLREKFDIEYHYHVINYYLVWPSLSFIYQNQTIKIYKSIVVGTWKMRILIDL
jgi:hypothetical protein